MPLFYFHKLRLGIGHTFTTLIVMLVIVIVAGFLLKHFLPLGDIANVAQIVEGVATLVLLVIAADIREAVKTRHLDGIMYIRSLIGTEEASERRRWVYQELKKKSWPLSPEDEQKAITVCRDFDHIGLLCRNSLIPVDIIAETYNRNILDMWNRLERFITQWRQQRNDEDYFWEFEWLANQADLAKKRLDEKRHNLR